MGLDRHRGKAVRVPRLSQTGLRICSAATPVLLVVPALGFSGPYERYLASQAGFLNDSKAYHAAMFERAPKGVDGPETTASIEE
jgi:hypothetical protein